MSLLFYPRKSHWHLHRGLRQCSKGKDTKKICEILAKEWKTKRCQVPSLDIFFHWKYLQSVSRFATPSFVKKLKIIAVVCGKVFESRRNCVSLWTKG